MEQRINMRCFILVLTFFTDSLGVKYSPPQVNWTNLSLDEWWGPEDQKDNQDTSIRPAQIVFSEEIIADLKARLSNHNTFRAPLNGTGFEYGFNTDALDYWINYWLNEYPFEAREQELNKYPQFKTNIQGLDIHFIRYKAETDLPTVPLLLLHGWPGSIREFHDSISLLTAVDSSRDFAVEVFIPSLPGVGFSDAAVRTGMGSVEVAIIMRNLMQRLGIQKYYVQGGDIGSVVGGHMATLFSEEVLGFHTNFPFLLTAQAIGLEIVGSLDPSSFVEPSLQDRIYPLKDKFFFFLLEETGYLHIQATKPDTVGIALTDSPTGLLAYLLEKFSSGVNPDNRALKDGGLKNTFAPEALIDNLMIYWVTRSITTAMRIYAENFNKRQFALGITEIATPVPTYALQPKHELAYQPPVILNLKFKNLVQVTPVDIGGHFFAFEHPDVFTSNVLDALNQFMEWHKSNEIGDS